MRNPRIDRALKFLGRWFSKAAELNLALFLCLYVLGCAVVGHSLGLHEFEAFVHHVFSFHAAKK